MKFMEADSASAPSQRSYYSSLTCFSSQNDEEAEAWAEVKELCVKMKDNQKIYGWM